MLHEILRKGGNLAMSTPGAGTSSHFGSTDLKVFIIHGRDMKPVVALQNFLRQLNFEVLTVEQLHARAPGPVSIQTIVSEGIGRADVIITLLTPDEAVALYDPETKELSTDTGWQARPNVYFELGIAFGKSLERTILATLGKVRPISDLGGIFYLRMDDDDAKAQLAQKLSVITQRPIGDQQASLTEGGFGQLRRTRWNYFDEIVDLEYKLAGIPVSSTGLKLLAVVERTVLKNPSEDWASRGKYKTTGKQFMEAVKTTFPASGGLVSDTYWWLSVLGFFQYEDISQFWKQQKWQSACTFCGISTRGLEFISKIKQTRPG
jgi:predicted nucleotide-binding protein